MNTASAFQSRPEFPPLLTGVPVARDAASAAVRLAPEAEPGTICYAERDDHLEVALILAPDRAMRDAVGVSFVASVALNDALGALLPPEIGVHLQWPDRVRLNGALAGRVRAIAPDLDPDAEADWLVIALELAVAADPHDDPGAHPDRTTLQDEGSGDIAMPVLIETWARHTMSWLHTYMTDGFGDVARAWDAVGWRRGEAVDAPRSGIFLGLDERGGMILKTDTGTETLPLTTMLERP